MAIDGGLWAWLGPKCKTMEGLHIERIENSIGAGRPDVNGCFKGSGFDIELKRGWDEKTSDKIKVKFQKAQPGWLKKRWKVGGNAWVLIKVGMGAKMRLYLIRGCDIGATTLVGDDLVWNTNERHLSDISVIRPDASADEVIKASAGFSF